MDAVITKEAAIDLSVGDNQIALLASQADGVDLTTKEGYEAGRQILASARTLRVGIETARKELKAFYLETGRKIDAEAKRLKQLVTDIEAPLQASKKAIDDEKARVKREAEEAKQREADAASKAERERIEKLQREEAAKIEKARAALQAERDKLAAERAEIEAEKERQAKAEADRLQAIEEENRKREQAEADRLQAIEDAKAAEEKAEADRIAKEKADKEREAGIAEAKRITEERKPDKQKLDEWLTAIRAVVNEGPELSTHWGLGARSLFFEGLNERLDSLGQYLKVRDEK